MGSSRVHHPILSTVCLVFAAASAFAADPATTIVDTDPVITPIADSSIKWPTESAMAGCAEGAAPAADALPPGEEPMTLEDALFGGKVNINLRLRFEYADFNDTGSPGYGHAETGRLRLGYGTKPWGGFSAYAEFEGGRAIDDETYNDTLNGNTTDAVIADPDFAELNQLYGKYEDHGFTVIGGRQRIILDNARFVGNVGWRNDEQTYDAASIKYKAPDGPLKDVTFYYAYLWQINRIFSDEMDWDSDSHIINVAFSGWKYGTITGFAYLLDFEDDAPGVQSNTIGFRFAGGFDVSEAYKLGYVLSYARQFDAGVAEMFEADYYNAELSLTAKESGCSFGVGYEVLGSDDGAYGFSTPLATLHAFQGFADAFLATPANGIEDLYMFVGGKLPYGINAKVIGHIFWEEQGGSMYGYEIDAVASKKVTDWMTVLAKVAYFEDNANVPAPAGGDRVRFWLQVEFNY